MPASIEHSEADSEDVLEALIQAELAKFQQQQAEKYAALLSEGQAVLPLPSPAPHQQQLRAQQKQQEALVGTSHLPTSHVALQQTKPCLRTHPRMSCTAAGIHSQPCIRPAACPAALP